MIKIKIVSYFTIGTITNNFQENSLSRRHIFPSKYLASPPAQRIVEIEKLVYVFSHFSI